MTKKLKKLEICLYELEGVGLILLDESGPDYYNQTGGGRCFQPRAEGFLAPLSSYVTDGESGETLEHALMSKFEHVEKFSETNANEFDSLMLSYALKHVSVDRAKLAESNEAWVYVHVNLIGTSLISGDYIAEGIVTWSNSD